jgi:hypothetical protein
MLERVQGLGVELELVDEFRCDQCVQRGVELAGLEVQHLFQDLRRELLADHRRHREDRLLPVLKPVDPRRENRLDARRNGPVFDCGSQPVRAVLAFQTSRIDQGPHEFFDEERIALGPIADQAAQFPKRIIGAQQPGEHLPDGLVPERPERDLAVVRP